MQSSAGYGLRKRHHESPKKWSYAVRSAGGLSFRGKIPNIIQLGERSFSRTSTGSGADGAPHIFNGVLQSPNVWWNESKRKANLNPLTNGWNDNCWIAFSRSSLHSPPLAGFSFMDEAGMCIY